VSDEKKPFNWSEAIKDWRKASESFTLPIVLLLLILVCVMLWNYENYVIGLKGQLATMCEIHCNDKGFKGYDTYGDGCQCLGDSHLVYGLNLTKNYTVTLPP